MTDQEWEESVTKLINHNGGRCVALGEGENKGHIMLVKPSGELVPALIVGEATKLDAQRDCDFLGLPFTNRGRQYVWVVFD